MTDISLAGSDEGVGGRGAFRWRVKRIASEAVLFPDMRLHFLPVNGLSQQTMAGSEGYRTI